MGKCKYCGQSAGIFRKFHETCEEKYKLGWAKMLGVAEASLALGVFETTEAELTQIAHEHFLQPAAVREALITGWEQKVDRFLDDNLLAPDEESKLSTFSKRFGLSQFDLDRANAYTRVVKAGVLRGVMAQKFSTRATISGPLPFQLTAKEHLIWLFTDVDRIEVKTRRHYEGRSSGVSVRITRGVYYRVGAFKGIPIETTYDSVVDSGMLGISTENLYFSGAVKTLKISYKKVIGLIPFSDGVGIDRDAVSSKRQKFRTGDGWFTYNLLSNLVCTEVHEG